MKSRRLADLIASGPKMTHIELKDSDLLPLNKTGSRTLDPHACYWSLT